MAPEVALARWSEVAAKFPMTCDGCNLQCIRLEQDWSEEVSTLSMNQREMFT